MKTRRTQDPGSKKRTLGTPLFHALPNESACDGNAILCGGIEGKRWAVTGEFEIALDVVADVAGKIALSKGSAGGQCGEVYITIQKRPTGESIACL